MKAERDKDGEEWEKERNYLLLIFYLLLDPKPRESSKVQIEGEKEKSCRQIIKEKGESFGENFLVFHFVFFSIFLGYKPWAREGELLPELIEKQREKEKKTSSREKNREWGRREESFGFVCARPIAHALFM
jgi:hypothetical protein